VIAGIDIAVVLQHERTAAPYGVDALSAIGIPASGGRQIILYSSLFCATTLAARHEQLPVALGDELKRSDLGKALQHAVGESSGGDSSRQTWADR